LLTWALPERQPDDLSESDTEAVRWAAEYIRVHAPTSDHALRLEERRTLLDEDFREIMAGTPDVTCGPELFDLKTRERDYSAQMAAYALMMFQERDWPEVRAHLLFTETKRAVVLRFTQADAARVVHGIIARCESADAKPTPCDYCGWCAWRATCAPYLIEAAKIAAVRDDVTPEARAAFSAWLEGGAHTSGLAQASGEVVAMVLTIARQLKKFCEGAEHFALEAAQKRGLTLPGYELATKTGKTYVTDVPQAFALAGLPQAEFLAGCQLRLNTSKKYPDQQGVIDLYAKFSGLKKAAAKRDLLKKLEPVVKKTKDSVSLRAVKDVIEVDDIEILPDEK
jgi:hypothetical protein